jgi:hypothetical protein
MHHPSCTRRHSTGGVRELYVSCIAMHSCIAISRSCAAQIAEQQASSAAICFGEAGFLPATRDSPHQQPPVRGGLLAACNCSRSPPPPAGTCRRLFGAKRKRLPICDSLQAIVALIGKR